MAVRLGLDRSGKGRLIGEANPTTNDPITSSPRGDARDIELTLEPSVRMRTGEIDIRSSPRARISNNRAAKSDPQDLLGAVLSAKTKFAEAEPLVIKLAWKALNWRAAHEGSNQPGAWDKSVSGLGWKYWRVIVNGKEYRYRDSVLNPASGLALNINLNTGLIGGPAWRPGIYRVQYIARDLPVIRLKDGRSGKIIIAKTIASNEVLFAITASQPATRPSPVPDNESKTPRDLVARKTAAVGGLQFRIAPSQSALGKGELASCMAWLKAGRIGFWWLDSRIAGIAGRMPRHAWLPFADKLSNNGQLVTGEYKGRNYVLVSDKPGQVMGPGTGKNAWALARVYAVKAGSDRPAIGFELDDRGAKLFAILTKANVGNTLAILVDGKVVSTPMLMSSLGKRGIITGSFTKQQIKDMTKALSASIPKRSSR
jgi:hypothetical protein